jgi:hemolysin III
MKKRTKLGDRALPDYTRGEEIFNMVTHIVGAAISVAILVLCVVFSAVHHDPWAVVGSAIYGATLIVMFTVSSVYHGLHYNTGKKVMQVIDHCDIYCLIAGTYTPILLAGIRPDHPVICWVIFAIEWGLAAVAIIFNAIDLKKYEKFSMFCYLGMGWTIVIALKPTIEAMGWGGFFWLLGGGVAYTLGALLYNIGKTKRYMHSVFHIFVVIAAVLQFFGIFFYVI